MQRVLDTSIAIALDAIDAGFVVEGHPSAGTQPLAAVSGADVGVWEMSPGKVTDVEADEVFVVLSGSATVEFHDGEVLDLVPGLAVRLRAGDQTVWTVHSTLRKLYVS